MSPPHSHAQFRTGRALAVDVPLGAVIGFLALIVAHGQAGRGANWHGPPDGGPPWRDGPPPWAGAEFGTLSPVTYACILVVVACVVARRFWPRSTFLAGVLGVAVYLGVGNPHGPILLAPVFLAYSLASAYPLRVWAPLTALAVPMLLAGGLGEPYLGLLASETWASLMFWGDALAVAAVLGVVARSRRDSRRRKREEELRRSAYEERLRITREVHDVVGHSLSVIHMQAGVALHVQRKRPEQVEPSLRAIRDTSKDALEELRRTLAVFRDPNGEGAGAGVGPGGQREPAPGLDRLDELVSAVGSAGRVATVHTEGERVALPTAVDHAAFRIVQEALTNVVRHADGAEATVRITYGPTEVDVEVMDNGPAHPDTAPPEGNGIAGMRERARAVGGRLSAASRPEGGFAVHAVLPVGLPGGEGR